VKHRRSVVAVNTFQYNLEKLCCHAWRRSCRKAKKDKEDQEKPCRANIIPGGRGRTERGSKRRKLEEKEEEESI
jgi:hypothetical protein